MVFRIVFASVLLHVAFASLRFAASLDALAHGASSLEVGVIVSLMALGPTFTAVAFGRYIDRVGTRLPIVIVALMLGTAGVTGVLFPVADHALWPLYGIALVGGLGFLFITLVSQKIVGFISTAATRQTSFAWLAMGMSASGLLSPILTGTLIDHAGFAAVFLTASGFAAAGLLMCAVSFTKLPATLGAVQPTAQKNSSWGLLKVPALRNVLIVSALVSMAWDLQHYMFPVYGHAVGLSATEIGWLTGIFYSATFLVRFLMPWTSKHFTEWQFLVLTLAVGGAAYAVFPLFTTFGPLTVAAFILGLGLGSSQPNVMSLLHSEAPAGRVGEALGVRTMFTNGCHTVLPTTFGILTGVFGAASIFIAMATILLTAAWASRASHRHTA